MAATIQSVTYIDPWGVAAPATFQTGLNVLVTGGPAGQVPAACLVQDPQTNTAGTPIGGTQIAQALGIPGGGSVGVMPSAPLSTESSYAVWVQWVAPGATPAWPVAGMLVASVIASLPAFTGGTATASQFAATWAFGPGAGGVCGASVQLFDVTSGTNAGFFVQQGTGGNTATTLSATSTYNAYIQAVQPAFAPNMPQPLARPYTIGPFAPPVPVTIAAPAVTLVAYDGAMLSVTWTPVALAAGAAVPASIDYTLYVLDTSVPATPIVLATFPGTPTGAVATIDLPLRGHVITVAGAVSLDGMQGPYGAPQPVMLVVPSITGVQVAAGGAGATVTIASASPSGAVTAELLRDGAVVESHVASSGPPPFATFTTPLAANFAWSVRAFVANPLSSWTQIGPNGAPFAVLATAVASVSIAYDGAELALAWPPVAGATSYEVALTGAITSTIATTAAALSVPAALVPGQVVTATVRALTAGGAGRGPASAPANYTMPAPSAPVLLASRSGGAGLRLNWSPAVGPGVTGYTVVATGTSPTSPTLTQQYLVGLATELAVPLPIADPTYLWSVTVAAMIGATSGAMSAAATLFTPQPLLGTATIAAGKATFQWTLNCSAATVTALQAAGAQLQCALVADGVPVATSSQAIAASGSAALTVPALGTATGIALTAVARIYSATALGPDSNALAVLAAQPTNVTAAFDGTSVIVDWQGSPPGATGHLITLVGTSAITVTAGAAPPIIFPAGLPASLAQAQAWTATVQPFGPSSTGLASIGVPVALPAVVAPQITSVRYDNGVLTLAWTAASALAATSYVVTVTRGTAAPVVQHVGPALSAVFAVDLAIGSTYGATVQAFVGNAAGPTSANAAIPAVLVAGGTLATDAVTGAATLTWPPPGGTVPNAYRVRLAINGELASEVATSTPSLALALPPGATAAAAIAAVWTTSGTLSIGPYAPAIPLPAVTPAPTAAAWDGAQLAVTWTPVAACTQYIVSVIAGGAVVATAPIPAPATSTTVTLTNPTSPAFVVIQAQLGTAIGPPSAQLALALAVPTLTAPSFDGRSLTATVSAPAGVTPTAYDVTLYRDGNAVQTATLPVPSQLLPLALAVIEPIADGAAYALRVRVRAGIAVGAPAIVAVLLSAPQLAALTCANGTLTATAIAPAGQTFTALLYTDGVAGAPQPLANNTAQWPAPAGHSYAVALRSTSTLPGAAQGPWSAPLAALVVAPSGVIATAGDGALACAWAGDPLGQYTVTVTAGAGTIAQATVRGLATTLPLAPIAGTAYALTVVPIAGIATGPAAALALVTDGCPINAVTIDAARAAAITFAPGTLDHVQPVLAWGETQLALPVQVATSPLSVAIADFVPDGASLALRGITGTATGPLGVAAALVLAAPKEVTADYDGIAVTVDWRAAAGAAVTGYQVSAVVGRTATRLGAATEPGVAFALAADPANPPTIVVQTVAGATTGPASVGAQVLVPALFLAPAAATPPQNAPSIAPRTSLAAPATDIVLYLPQLFATPPTTPPSTATFALATTQTIPFVYQLTIPAGSAAWTFSPAPVRGALVTEYTGWLAALTAATATPIAIATVQDAIARAMPQTFAETLYYAHGLQAANAAVDLRPGTILRAEYESFSLPDVHGADAPFLDGYVAAGSAEYEVVAYTGNGAWLAGLDAFLATLAAAGGVAVPAMPPDATGRAQGGGGAIDTFFTQFQQPFCRLVYPPAILDQGTKGSAFPYMNPVLLAAATPGALDTAMANVRNGAAIGGTAAACYFRGRTTLTAAIRVFINNTPTTVALGTTIGNVLAGAGARPPIAGLALTGVSLVRPYGAAVVAGGAYAVGAGWRVRLDWAVGTAAYGPTNDWLDLPLVAGDRLDFGGAR